MPQRLPVHLKCLSSHAPNKGSGFIVRNARSITTIALPAAAAVAAVAADAEVEQMQLEQQLPSQHETEDSKTAAAAGENGGVSLARRGVVLSPETSGLHAKANVDELYLCGLRGTALSPSFSLFRTLRYVWLSRNCLRSLTPMALCPSLCEVYADCNELFAVPLLSASRGSLKLLSLANNKVQTLATQLPTIAAYKRLTCLDLRHNPVVTEALYRPLVVQAGGDLEVLDLQAVAAEERRTASRAHAQKGLSGSSLEKQQQSRRHKGTPPHAAAAAAASAAAAAAAAGASTLHPVLFSECERLALRAAAAAKRRRDNYRASQPSLSQQLLFGASNTPHTFPKQGKNVTCSSTSNNSSSSNSSSSSGKAFAPWQLEVLDEQLRLLGVAAHQTEKDSAAATSAAAAATGATTTAAAAPAASAAAANRRSSHVVHARQLSDAAAAAAEAAILPWGDWRNLCLQLQKDPWAIGLSLSPHASDKLEVYIRSSNEKAMKAAADAAAAAAAAAAPLPISKKTVGNTKNRAVPAAGQQQQQQQHQQDAVVQQEQHGAPVKELRQFLLQQQWTLRSPAQIRESVESLYTRAQQQQHFQPKALAAATQAIQLSLFGEAFEASEALETRAPSA
ncbi:hypothetical protein ACSSS7_003991 [Eimeria intestinalis]